MKEVLIAAMLCFAIVAAQAQDDPFGGLEGDPFADLEADAAATASKKEAGPVGKLVENLGGKAVLQYTGFFKNRVQQRGSDNQNHFLNSALNLETWTSGQDWRVDVAAWLQAGNQENTFSGTSLAADNFFRDLDIQEHRYLSLNELYLTRNFDTWDLTLGKKIAKNGIASIYSPADRLRPAAGFDPLSVRDLGVWQVWADIYGDNVTWTVAVLPVYQPDIMPPTSSRWVGAPAVGGDPPSSYPDIDPKDFGWFGRAKTVTNGWDLFASLYTGPSRQYVLKQTSSAPVRAERNVAHVIKPALGYSTTRGRWEFHGEVANTTTLRNEDEDYISCVQGTTITIDGDRVTNMGLEQILATFEVAWEWVTGFQTAPNFVTTSDSTRPGQSDFISRLQFKVNEEVSLEYGGHYIVEKRGYSNRFGGRWKFMNNFTWYSGFEFFGGSTASGPEAGLNNLGVNYGGWRYNNRFISAVEYKF